MKVKTMEDALDVYFAEVGSEAAVPSSVASGYDESKGGWLFENINGPLALVREDGTIAWPVHDEESAWALPE